MGGLLLYDSLLIQSILPILVSRPDFRLPE